MSDLTNFPNGVASFGIPVYPYSNLIHVGSTTMTDSAVVIGQTHHWVNGSFGSDGNDGLSPASPKLTMDAVFDTLNSGDIIHFTGNITEQLTTPAGIFDVTIIGEGNSPRNADAFDTNNGYTAATWKYPSSPTAATPLLKIQQQGWRLVNILFTGSLSATPLVQSFRDAGAGDLERDASHLQIIGCRFDGGGPIGFQDSGGCNFLQFYGNSFRGFTTAAMNSIVGAGQGTLLNCKFYDNVFHDNASHIRMALNQSTLRNNVIGKFTASTGFGIDLTGGIGSNMVSQNHLSGDYDGDYVAASGDDWAGNYSMDLASDEVGDNGITTAVPVA